MKRALLLTIALTCLFRTGEGATTGSSWDHTSNQNGNGADWTTGSCSSLARQSPIDLDSSAKKSAPEKSFVFKGESEDVEGKLTNNGHVIQFDLPSDSKILVTGGNFEGEYKILQLHFHSGSEHTLDGGRKTLEMHVVMQNQITSGDQFAVLGYMFEIGAKNMELDSVFYNLNGLSDKGASVDITIDLKSLLQSGFGNFFRYAGSLTTPPCTEAVLWTVFEKIGTVSQKQIDEMSALTSLNNNFRKVQKLSGRVVAFYEMERDSVKFDSSASRHSVDFAASSIGISLFLARWLQ